MKLIKKNYKLLIGFTLGLIVAATGVYAATVLSSEQVDYDNTNSGLSSTTVKGALDELSTKTELKNRDNIVEGYTYNSSTCVTGEEDTCVKTDCYKDMIVNSCKTGDIIKYKVNDTDIVTFHVMYDNGTTLTMQSQKNTINNTQWISAADYATYNTDGTSCSRTPCNDEGPMTALVALERVTKSWTNVNDQTYTIGTTVFKNNKFTGCDDYNSCTTNTYTLGSRTAKARMITAQETVDLGCTKSERLCPIWMYNYLTQSVSHGGTVNDSTIDTATGSTNNGYHTMNSNSSDFYNAWRVTHLGYVDLIDTNSTYTGARAVVVISK